MSDAIQIFLPLISSCTAHHCPREISKGFDIAYEIKVG